MRFVRQRRPHHVGHLQALTAVAALCGPALLVGPAHAEGIVAAADRVSVEQADLAAGRLVTGLTPYALGQVSTAANPLQAEAATALALVNNVHASTQVIVNLPDVEVRPVIDVGGAMLTQARQALVQVKAMADAAVADVNDALNDLDIARLLDDATNLVNFYMTGYVNPCATVSHDILRTGTPHVYTPTADDVPQPDELDVMSLVGVPAGVTALLSDCLPEGYASSDGGITVAGQVVTQPIGMPTAQVMTTVGSIGVAGNNCDGCGGPGPSTFENVRKQDVGRGTYGGYWEDSKGYRDGSNLYVTFRFYRPSVRDKFGDTIIAWQSGSATVREHTNLKKFETYIAPEDYNLARFEDYTPQGDNEYEGTTPVTAGLNFGVVPSDKGGVTYGVSVARQFGVSHTKFGGDIDFDGKSVHSARGGYRIIAQGHRNNSRAYSQAAAWTFPSGASEMFKFWVDQYAYKR